MSAHGKRQAWLIACWVVLAGAVLGAEYLSGPYVRFPIAFLLPVMLAAWYSGRVWALVFAGLLPFLRLFIVAHWNDNSTLAFKGIDAAIQIIVLAALALFVDRTAALLREVKTLRGIVPMCSFCHRIRDEKQEWIPLEKYIHVHSEAQVSHGLCPSCYKKHYGQADGT